MLLRTATEGAAAGVRLVYTKIRSVPAHGTEWVYCGAVEGWMHGGTVRANCSTALISLLAATEVQQGRQRECRMQFYFIFCCGTKAQVRPRPPNC